LLHNYPGLDRLIVVDRNYLKSWRELAAVRRQLRGLACDICLDPQSLTKSSVLGWLSGAKRRIGFAGPQGRELSLWLNNERVVPRRTHIVDRQMELLRPLIGDRRLEPRFELPCEHHDTIDHFLREARLEPSFAVLNPGAGWDSKLWPPDRFAQVAQYLGARHRLPSAVVWAGDRERAWAEQIVAQSAGNARLAPSTSLPELASLFRRSRLCVAGDTGPLHLAAAVGTPCVGLYGTTRPVDSGPYGPQHESVQAYFHRGTARQRRRAANEAMQAIAVAQVTKACDRILSQRRDMNAA
jgi:ADP-heptose:LPS heptosyltransferase